MSDAIELVGALQVIAHTLSPRDKIVCLDAASILSITETGYQSICKLNDTMQAQQKKLLAEIERLRAQLFETQQALIREGMERDAAIIQVEIKHAALQAARDWIGANTNCEAGTPADDIMYERGWWDADGALMKQINVALSSDESEGA